MDILEQKWAIVLHTENYFGKRDEHLLDIWSGTFDDALEYTVLLAEDHAKRVYFTRFHDHLTTTDTGAYFYTSNDTLMRYSVMQIGFG